MILFSLINYPLQNVSFPLLLAFDWNNNCNSCLKFEYELFFDTGNPTGGYNQSNMDNIHIL